MREGNVMLRRAFILGGAALLSGCGAKAESRPLNTLFRGFSELQPNGDLAPIEPFYDDEYPTVYMGADREVYTGCSVDILAWKDSLLNAKTDRDFVPILVLAMPHPSNLGNTAFLDEFRDLQRAIPEARVLTHPDPQFVKFFSIRNGASYDVDANGYVNGHSRNLHIFAPSGEQLLFGGNGADRNGRMNPEAFALNLFTQRFEGNISGCYVDSALKSALDDVPSCG